MRSCNAPPAAIATTFIQSSRHIACHYIQYYRPFHPSRQLCHLLLSASACWLPASMAIALPGICVLICFINTACRLSLSVAVTAIDFSPLSKGYAFPVQRQVPSGCCDRFCTASPPREVRSAVTVATGCCCASTLQMTLSLQVSPAINRPTGKTLCIFGGCSVFTARCQHKSKQQSCDPDAIVYLHIFFLYLAHTKAISHQCF